MTRISLAARPAAPHHDPGVEPALITAALARLVRAVGTAEFADALLAFWRQAICPVDQLVGFTRHPGRPGQTLFTVGDMPLRLAQALTQRYLDAYHLMDPTVDELRVLHQADAWLTRLDPALPASSVYRAFFFDHSQLVDRVAILTRWGDEVVACHGYRRLPSGPFVHDDLEALQPWLGTLAALMRQHHALRPSAPSTAPPKPQPVATAVPPPERLQALDRLSARERAVYQRLLAGLSTDAIGLDLGVSSNTVRTFRKKLYRKLGVNSRLELYQKYMHLSP